MYFLSVDGGATKTISVVYNQNSEILGVGISGSTNLRNVGLTGFKRNLKNSVLKSLHNSGIKDADEYTFAIAGMKDSEKSSSEMIEILSSLFPNRKISYFNDGEAGFFSRFPDGNGIVVAPGTGMVGYGRVEEKVVRSSGWGWFLDDEGGAFYIGRRTIQEVVKLFDGRSEFVESSLMGVIREHYSLSDPRDIINKVYGKKIDIRDIASIARFTSRESLKGDSLAKTIMEDASEETAKTAISIYNRLGRPEQLEFSGYGGVFRSGEWYWEKVKSKIRDSSGNRKFIDPIYGYEAVLGSIVLTYRREGVYLSGYDIEGLRKVLDDYVFSLPEREKKRYLLID
ncbi:MAG: hypothetical protein M1526_06815 [Candidatus Thermoplasmatota archaeon]|jgi:N-acetylglucosamine kinase-like BadF-type ATPase|nr:hypothetical protein [Candidatus Thermoplasmatota archaeon]MCL5680467.1 hypothetical protein [Candidatus Thermoplasmatota archaeon]